MPDAVSVAPNHYKVIEENDRVRVLEFHGSPGHKTEMHSHPAVIAVAINSSNNALLPSEVRIEIIQDAIADMPGVSVAEFDGLLVDFVIEQQADCIIRGLRAISDFEYEFQMALMNRQLQPTVETIFLMPSQEYIFLSSRIIKEIANTGNDVRNFISEKAAEAIEKKLGSK